MASPSSRGVLKAIYCGSPSLDLSWAQELCIYMFIWMAKFGAAYGVRTGIHVGVDVFVNMLPPASRKRVVVFSLLCGALFTGIVAVFGGAFVGQMSRPASNRTISKRRCGSSIWRCRSARR